MQVVILAGGIGSRLSPWTKSVPKPLLPMLDRTLLEQVIYTIPNNLIDEVIVAGGYKVDMIKSYFDSIECDFDVNIVNENILLISQLDNSVNFKLNTFKTSINVNCDHEQFNRIFTNLFKNSIDSLNEKFSKNPDFQKKISIDILKKDDYIQIIIKDNGIGFGTKKLDDLLKPYYTTKKNGTGLGLPIVNKIINDHNGTLTLFENKSGAKIKINLPLHK